ncbi:hypothetical protein [Prevotella corporis]|uniref:Uncharacterized protein n=1 Tax=Prevotella corporis TaxID=28128 RepID=A0A133PW12_9BACT|nr:hypothetical protein [Prevotella corporis]KXA33539.1 hypothetical protein HMPREF3226_02412 [Prevotella corporis]
MTDTTTGRHPTRHRSPDGVCFCIPHDRADDGKQMLDTEEATDHRHEII